MTDSNITKLEEEGDIAADYLEELLDICDLDGDIDIDVENGRAALEIVSEEYGDRWLRKLVGEDGRVLDAIQELTRLAVQTKTGERSRLMLDIAGYRAGIKTELAEAAREAIAQVRDSGESVRLTPMNPFERKVVHDVVKAEGLVSESEGAEPHRRVVIHPGTSAADAPAETGDVESGDADALVEDAPATTAGEAAEAADAHEADVIASVEAVEGRADDGDTVSPSDEVNEA